MNYYLTKKMFCFFLMSSIFFLCFSVGLQEVEIRKENGVTVVYNPKKPVSLPGVTNKLLLTEDLVIGDEYDDEDYMFSQLQSIQVDDDGNIISLDRKEGCIKIFDRDGQFLKKIGTKGQGPGEIELPYSISLIDNRYIAVNNYGNNRFSYFTKDGECVNEINKGKYRAFVTVADSRGNIYGDLLIFGDEVTFDLIKLNQKFEPVMTVHSMRMPKEPPPALLTERYKFEVRKDETFVWGRTYDYVLHVLGPDGDLIKKIVKDHSPRRINSKSLKIEMRKIFPDREIPENFKVPSHFPKNFPSFQSFACDDEGRIYVRTSDRVDDDYFFYDVFDAEGRYIYRYPHPDNEDIAIVKNNSAYSIIRANEHGIPLIKRYSMRWEK